MFLLILMICAHVHATHSGTPFTTPVLNNPVVCYLFSGPLADLGYSYQWNIARRTVAAQLKTMLEGNNTNFTITSFSVPNVNAMNSATLLRTVNTTIETQNCSILLSLTSAPTDSTPDFFRVLPYQFPNVRFYVYDPRFTFYNITFPGPTCNVSSVSFQTNVSCDVVDSSQQNTPSFIPPPTTLPPNFRGFASSWFAGWYVAGVAAAAQCRRCVGFITPLHTRLMAVNAFARGMRWAALNGYAPSTNMNASSTTCPLYNIIQNSYFDPSAEGWLASLFLAKGCDIIAYWANDHVVTTKVKAAMGTSSVPLFTIANNADAALLYGDVVLVSVLLQVTDVLQSVVEDLVFNNTIQSRFSSGTAGQTISSISPRANRKASQAAAIALAHQSQSFDLLCGGFQNTSGSWVYTGCSTEAAELLRVGQLDILISPLPDFQRPNSCPPGTEPHYDLNAFQLSCVACPLSTVSSGFGSMCTACSSGQYPNGNQTACLQSPFVVRQATNYGLAVGLPVAVGSVLIATLAAILIARKLLRHRERVSLAACPPPSGPVVGLVLLGVDPKRSASGWRQQSDFASDAFSDIAFVVDRACAAHRAFECFAGGDIHLVATHDVVSAVKLADDIVRDFYRSCSRTSAHLRLRVVVSAGRIKQHQIISNGDESGAAKGMRNHSSRHAQRNGECVTVAANGVVKPAPTESVSAVVAITLDSILHHTAASAPAASLTVPSMSVGVDMSNSAPTSPVETLDKIDWHRIDSVTYVGEPIDAMRQCFTMWKGGAPNSSIAMPVSLTKWTQDVSDEIRRMLRAGRTTTCVTWTGPNQPPSQACHVSLLDDGFSTLPKPFDTDGFSKRGGKGGNSGETSPSTRSLPIVDAVAMERFAMLSEGDVQVLLLVGFEMLHQFLKCLDVAQRRIVVHTACSRLHVDVDRLLQHGKLNEGERTHVVVSHLALVRLITTEILSVMDEQVLDSWLRCVASDRSTPPLATVVGAEFSRMHH